MEVCVESYQSAINASEGGAKRIELCSALSEGGLTPSVGLFAKIKCAIKIPIFVMLRPKPGNFTYSVHDFDIIKHDAVEFLRMGADGFVFGALKHDGQIDMDLCNDLRRTVANKPCTFHRAFDWTPDPITALHQVSYLGYTRILTSGQQDTARRGVMLIKELTDRSAPNFSIMPGGGINRENVFDIISMTGATEFHGSARKSVDQSDVYRNANCPMGPHDNVEKVTSAELVQNMVSLYLRAQISISISKSSN